MKNDAVKINLGTVEIDRETWEIMRRKGFDRQAIKDVVLGNGLTALSDFAFELDQREDD